MAAKIVLAYFSNRQWPPGSSRLVLSGDDCICGAESAREEAAALAAETEISADEAGIPSFMHRQVFPD